MFAFSVPMIGFLLYFQSLLAAITIRWQQRETAVIISRGMLGRQLLLVCTIEAGMMIGLGLVLGLFAGLRLAQAMGYTSSFMRFVRRSPLPVSSTTISVPLLAAALVAMFLARLVPVWRSLRTSIVAHERHRSRPPKKPAWQRFYLDFLLLIPTIYAYWRLIKQGTLVPEAITGERATTVDPLLFLVPALFTLTMSLLLVRLFPFLMRIGDWLSALGRQATPYMAFRQLARQSSQYTNALLLVITSLSLGGFMASMAGSLDDWLFDQVYYSVGSDVLMRQMIDPEYAEEGIIPPEGAWSLPIESYLDVPGVLDATRVGMYPATVHLNQLRGLKQTFIGVDRLDLPRLLFFRADFADQSLGGLMNQLASREDAVLLSERFMREANFQVGSKISIHISILDLILNQIALTSDFTVAGTYRYFPTVYEQGDTLGDQQTAIIGNLDFLFEQIGGPELHHIWFKLTPDADRQQMIARVEEMGVFIKEWRDAKTKIAQEQARSERVGIFGTLTVGFLAATVLSGIGLLIYNYASLQERLFRFTILRAVGLSLLQVISQIVIEYLVLMVYSVLGGAAIGAWASELFIPFFQAIDEGMLRPPSIIPVIAWQDIAQISGAFTIVLVVAQLAVVAGVLRKGVFQALRLGDQE
jgi:putative ABC transport system permease protein